MEAVLIPIVAVFGTLIFFGGLIFFIDEGPDKIMNLVRSAIERRRVKQDRRHRLKMAQIEAAKPPKATCECGHSFAFHRGGTCHADEAKPVAWKTRYVSPDDAAMYTTNATVIGRDEDDDGTPFVIIRYATKWEPGQCACVTYVGPEPIVSLTMQDLSGNYTTPREERA